MMDQSRKSWPWRKKLELKSPSPPPSFMQPPPSQHLHDSRPLHHHQELRRNSHADEDEESAHLGLTGSQVEGTVKMLTQRVTDLSSMLVAKEELANQQARIAKEAVEDMLKKDSQLKQTLVALKEEKAAREKTNGGYWATQQELEKVCQQRSLGEGRMAQLNEALKECMDELHHAKNQLELKAQEANSRKREWEKQRADLETENVHLKRQLMEATAENIAVSKTLQERSRSLAEINEQKGKAESEVKVLQVQIESVHKDMDAYKYELHLLRKEIQIRNDEREQDKKVMAAMHKQHLENVKKIAKLESECNRLRGLIRKKLPGAAAVAQMRVEADHVGKKRLPSPKLSPVSSQDQKELEALTDRLSSMEEDTKLLKEALVKKSAELQMARQLGARTATKLLSAEAILEALAKANQPLQMSSNDASTCAIKLDTTQQQAITLPSVASPNIGGESSMEVLDWGAVSLEDGNNDDELSNAGSWASALIAELSHFKKNDENVGIAQAENSKPRDVSVMQDFDLPTTLQGLSKQLSSIGENILALPSSMKHVSEQGSNSNGIESGPLDFGLLRQIMEEFTSVKQHLVEIGKAVEFEKNQIQVMEAHRSTVQGSEVSKTESSPAVIDECFGEDRLHLDISSAKKTCMGAITEIVETLLVLVESKRGDLKTGTEEEEGFFDCLQKSVGALERGQAILDVSEKAAVTILCKVGDLLNGHSSCDLETDGAEPSLLVEASEAPADDMDGETNKLSNKINSGDYSGNINSAEKISCGHDAEPDDSSSTVNAGVVTGAISGEEPAGISGRDTCNLAENDGNMRTTHCKLTLQLEILQQDVERLTRGKEEIIAKLLAAEQELEQQRARVATLEAESLQLVHDKASLANELSAISSQKQKLEDDLADARASLDDLHQQVVALTSELADQATRYEELKGNILSLSDVGTPIRGRKSLEIGADAKTRKENEIQCAKAQLAECQRSILVLSNQLKAMSSLHDHVAAGASFDSSLESATSTDHSNLPSLEEGAPAPPDSSASSQLVARSTMQRQVQPAFVRTRGGRLVSADQFWGSSGDVLAPGSEMQGAATTNSAAGYSCHSRHVLPRPLYTATYPQSPLHEYVSESANMYSPPETALSSPASSPARYTFQLDRSRRASLNGAANAMTTMGASGRSSVSPARKAPTPSRIARFFTRTKTQR